jgi:acyl-CoA reductase-like NAD-dependent aldehyde dehydrogenase
VPLGVVVAISPYNFLLYWYISTDSDAEGAAARAAWHSGGDPALQFSCFTGTKVQILTQKALQRVPLGVVVAIPPYNYPLNLAGSKVGPALMAGNSVVMKPPSAGAVTGILGIAAGAQRSAYIMPYYYKY